MKNLTKTLLIISGTLFLILAIVGMLLPVLPTTPFLLLAAFCYSRSSTRFYQWLITNILFGEYIRNYREGRGIPRKHKVFSIAVLWLTIGYAAWFVVPQWWLKLILLGVAVGVTIHLALIKTFKPEAEIPARPVKSALPEEAD